MSVPMTTIEKVARAQYAVIRERNPEMAAWEDLPAADRDFVFKHVRSGIEAMRIGDDYAIDDPVIEAVQTEVDIWPEDQPRPSESHVQFVSRDEAVAIWNAGIAAALKELP